MRIFWASLLLAGLCMAKEEEATDDLQEIEGRRLERTGETAPCNGCYSGSKDKPSSSSIVVPAIDLPNLSNLFDKRPVQHVVNTAQDLIGSVGTVGSDVTDDLLLKIGDIVSYVGSLSANKVNLNSASSNDFNDNGIFGTTTSFHDQNAMAGGLAGLAGLAGLVGTDLAGGTVGTLMSLLNLLKSGVLELGSRGLEIANFILAIIGLALIVAYVVENDGELGVLGFGYTGTGTGTGLDYTNARSFADNPIAEGLTNLVYDAISKYE